MLFLLMISPQTTTSREGGGLKSAPVLLLPKVRGHHELGRCSSCYDDASRIQEHLSVLSKPWCVVNIFIDDAVQSIYS